MSAFQDVDYIGDGLGLAGRTADQMLAAGCSMEEAVRIIREKMLMGALKAAKGNISVAGRKLRQHRNTIARELERLNMSHLPEQIRRKRVEPVQAELIFKPGLSLVPPPSVRF
ncbi:MAG TPA: hypothetical protein VJX23_03090 [Candidatus Binataceae bacterium]|nr:hypothetical protein [Candidatus Binataceae bacterium]